MRWAVQSSLPLSQLSVLPFDWSSTGTFVPKMRIVPCALWWSRENLPFKISSDSGWEGSLPITPLAWNFRSLTMTEKLSELDSVFAPLSQLARGNLVKEKEPTPGGVCFFFARLNLSVPDGSKPP